MSMKQKAGVSEAQEQQFWQMVFETHQASGLTVKQFCKNEGLAEWSFYHWKKKLRQLTDPKPANTSKENLPTKESAPATRRFQQIAQLSSRDKELKIEFPAGINLHVHRHCDRQLLRETIAILRDHPC